MDHFFHKKTFQLHVCFDQIKAGLFDQGCRESSAMEVTRPERPRFGGQGCQESLAVAILARLYQTAFSR